MLTYFLLGCLAGSTLIGTISIGHLMRYRREVLRLKKSLNNTEHLNAELQQSLFGIENADQRHLSVQA